MPTIGVFDDVGQKIPFENLTEAFGEMAGLIRSEGNFPEELKNIDVSPTRLIGPKFFCPYKPFLASRLRIYVYYKSLWGMNRGTILHDGISLPSKELPIKASIERKRGGLFTVGGVMDGYDEIVGKIFEIKTIGMFDDRFELPKLEHIYQTRIYKFLAECLGKKAKSAVFFYVSSNDWKKFEIELEPLTKDEVETDYEFYCFCKESPNKGPKPEAALWVCNYCDFWRYCKYSRANFKINGTQLHKISKPSCQECDNVVGISEALEEKPRRVL